MSTSMGHLASFPMDILMLRNGNWSQMRNTYDNVSSVVRWKDEMTDDEGIVAITMKSNKKKTEDIIR